MGDRGGSGSPFLIVGSVIEGLADEFRRSVMRMKL